MLRPCSPASRLHTLLMSIANAKRSQERKMVGNQFRNLFLAYSSVVAPLKSPVQPENTPSAILRISARSVSSLGKQRP
jgi:hypothetical protein